MSDGRSSDNKTSEVDAGTAAKEKRGKGKGRLLSSFRFSLKKTFRMSSKGKEFEKEGEAAGSGLVAKKAGKKSKKSKPAANPKSAGPDADPKSSGGRRASLDRAHPKPPQPPTKSEERRATSPDIKAEAVDLRRELEEAGLKQSLLHVPKGVSSEAEASDDDDFRTPVCQSPDGSFREAKSRASRLQRLAYLEPDTSHDSENDEAQPTGAAAPSSSEASFESAFQSAAVTPQLSLQRMKESTDDEASLLERTLLKEEEEEVANQGSAKFIGEEAAARQGVVRGPLAEVRSSEEEEEVGGGGSADADPTPPARPERVAGAEEGDGEGRGRPSLQPAQTTLKYTETQPQLNDRRECLFKILVIGELGAGKTSIIKRYVHEFFSQNYRATIGVDFALKVLNWDQNTVVRLQLWDIAGQERFGNMTRVYYKEAVGAFIVFDVTRTATFEAVLKWKLDLDSKVQLPDGSPIPCVLLANKCDQPKEGMVSDQFRMDDFCKQNSFSDWFETSAKENINIDSAAKSLVSKILQNDKFNLRSQDTTRDGSKLTLDGRGEQNSGEGKKRSCC